jgi:iron complex outermembrane receptor protein
MVNCDRSNGRAPAADARGAFRHNARKPSCAVSVSALCAAFLLSGGLSDRALAQAAPAANTAGPSSSSNDIVVVGKESSAAVNQMKAETAPVVAETLSRGYIALQSPTSNPLILMSTLPSVNISTVDAFGLNGGGNAQIHGLSTNDLGWILDGVPVYSQGAGFSNEMIAVQDLETLTVEPGSSNLSDPTISSAGGTIYLSMRDPAKTAGGLIEIDAGSDALNKEFIRFDTGELGATGVRAFASFAHASVNNWRGAGDTDQKHLDLKILKEWSNGSRTTFEISANQQYYGYYYFPSESQFENYSTQSSQFNTDKTYQGVGDTSYYKLNMQDPFNFLSLQLPSKIVVNANLTVTETPYLWLGVGGGTGGGDLTQGQTYEGSQQVNVDLTDGGKIPLTGGQVLANTGFSETTIQAGNVLRADWTLGHNTLAFGWWYEHERQAERDVVGKVNQATGTPYALDITGYLEGGSQYRLPNGQPYYINDNNQGYENHTLFIGDTYTAMGGKLNLSAGVKEAFLSEFETNYLPGATRHTGLTDSVPLPQASLRYQINASNQVFVHAERDYRLPFTFSLVSGYSLGSGALTTGAGAPRPESAVKEEIGYRYQSDLLMADVSLFNIDLTDRLLTLNTYLNGNPVSETVNAGDQTSRGLDAQVSTHPLFGYFTPYVAFEYLDAKITTNTAAINVNGVADYLPTKGKTQVQSPKYQASLGLTFADGPFTAGLRLRYVDAQYSTLMDDEGQPAFVTDDLSLSYQLPTQAGRFGPKIQLNLYNLTNALTRSGVYQFQYNANNAVGVSGATIAPSGSPSYYVEPSFAAVLSISTTF